MCEKKDSVSDSRQNNNNIMVGPQYKQDEQNEDKYSFV